MTASPFPLTSPAPSREINPPVQDSNANPSLIEAENVPTEEVADLASEDDNALEIQDENTYHSLQVTPEQLKSWQKSDPSLKKLREAANNPQEGYTAIFFFKQGLL